uniref:Uncharacterized protein n=1 Tax=Glycine max TaxID=3847 RepID=C6T3I2_SOYBN|nr:unknown [Glycine max]
MATFPTLHGLHNPLPRSQFLGQDHPLTHQFPLKQQVHHKTAPTHEVLMPRAAKFNILEMMGGRGLCNGEKGLQQELKRQVVVPQSSISSQEEEAPSGEKEEQEGEGGDDDEGSVEVPEDGFEKEMMGLTGGFPGGEKGLKKFIEKKQPSYKATNNVVSLSF